MSLAVSRFDSSGSHVGCWQLQVLTGAAAILDPPILDPANTDEQRTAHGQAAAYRIPRIPIPHLSTQKFEFLTESFLTETWVRFCQKKYFYGQRAFL